MGMDISVRQMYGVRLSDLATQEVKTSREKRYDKKTGELLPESEWRKVQSHYFKIGEEVIPQSKFHDFVQELGLEWSTYEGGLVGIVGTAYGESWYECPQDGELKASDPPQETIDKVNEIFERWPHVKPDRWIAIGLSA